MSAVRLGVATAVFDGQGAVLLSRRGDFAVWNLPSGRLDYDEPITLAAAREVREETGIVCGIGRPVGLYYQKGRSRLNMLFNAQSTGGELRQQTDETIQNGFFDPHHLPQPFFGDYMVQHAVSGGTHLHVLTTPPAVLRRVQRQLAVRWLRNLFAGKPEPRWASFEVQASLALLDRQTSTVLSVPAPGDTERRALPALVVNGDSPPWEQVRIHVRDTMSAYELRSADLRWVGLYQHIARRTIELIFCTDIQPTSPISGRDVEWIAPSSTRWWQGYRPYLIAIQNSNSHAIVVTE